MIFKTLNGVKIVQLSTEFKKKKTSSPNYQTLLKAFKRPAH